MHTEHSPMEALRYLDLHHGNWLVVIPTVEYPLENTAIFTGGIDGESFTLSKAAVRHNKPGLLSLFEEEADLPVKRRTTAWVNAASMIGVTINIVEEIEGGHPDFFSLRPLYVAKPYMFAVGFFLTRTIIQWQQLGKPAGN